MRFGSGARQGDAPVCLVYIQSVDPNIEEQRQDSLDILDDLYLTFRHPLNYKSYSATVVTYGDDVARVGIVQDPSIYVVVVVILLKLHGFFIV